MSDAEDISRREQLRALVRVARYRPAFTAAIIGAGVFAAALEAVGLSFILPIIKLVQTSNPAEVEGLMTVFIPYSLAWYTICRYLGLKYHYCIYIDNNQI